MTGVWGGFSVQTEGSCSDLSQGPGPEDAPTEERCRLNSHDLQALHTARLIFRNTGLERTAIWQIMIYEEIKQGYKEFKQINRSKLCDTAEYRWVFWKLK